MLVRRKDTQELGTIDDKDFNPDMFEKVIGEKPKSQTVLESVAKGIVDPFVSTGKNIVAAVGQAPLMLAEGKALEAGNTGLAEKLNKVRRIIEPIGKTEEEFAADSSDKGKFIAKQVGDALKIASYGVPIGGATKILGAPIKTGVFGGGALTGGLYNLGEQVSRPVEQFSPAELAVSSLTGGVTAWGLNKVLGGGGAGQKLEETGKAINKKVLNPQADTSPFMFGQKEDIINIAKKEGFWGKTPQTIEKEMNTTADKIIKARDAIALSSKNTAPSTTIKKLVEDVVNKESATSTKVPMVKQWINTLFKGKKLDGKAMVDINSQVTKVARSGSTDKALAAQAMKPVIDQAMNMIDKRIVPLNARLSGLYKVADGTGIALDQTVGHVPLVSTRIPAQPFQWLGGKVGTGLEKTGRAIKPTTTPLSKVLNKGVMGQQPVQNVSALMPQLLGGQEQPTTQTTPQAPVDTTQPILSPQGQWRWDNAVGDWVPNEQAAAAGMPTKEELQTAMINDLQSGGKNITELKTIYDTLYGSGAGTDTKTKQRQMILQQVTPILTRIASSAINAPAGMTGAVLSTVGKIPGVSGGEAEYLARDTEAFAKVIAQAFAGEVGQATDKDVARWLKMMPQPGDTMDERKRQTMQLLKQIEYESKVLGIEVPSEITTLINQLY